MKIELFTFECDLFNKDEKNIDFIVLHINNKNFYGSLFALSWNECSGFEWDFIFINGIIKYFKYR